MESLDKIQQKDNTPSVETVMENNLEGLKIPHKYDHNNETVMEESTQRRDMHDSSVLGISEIGSSSYKGLVKFNGKEEGCKSCITKEKKDDTSSQTQKADSSQVSYGERFYEGKQIESSSKKDNEKHKEDGAQGEVNLELTCIDKSSSGKENTIGEISVKCLQENNGLKGNQNDDGLRKSEETIAEQMEVNACKVNMKEKSDESGNCRSENEAMSESETLKEPCLREKDVEEGSYQDYAFRYEERMRFSTRLKRNASIALPEGFAVFRQSLKDAKFLSCIIPSDFYLPPEIRLHRHRSIASPWTSSKTAKTTKTQVDKRKSVNMDVSNLKRDSPSSLKLKPFEKMKTHEKLAVLKPVRNAKSIKKTRGILFNQKTKLSVVRKSLRQKLRALNVKKKIINEVNGLHATRQSTFQRLKSNEQKKMTEKVKPDNEARYCESNEDAKKKEFGMSETDNDKYKHLSSIRSSHLQKLWQIRRTKRKMKAKFTHRKRQYLAYSKQVQHSEGYIRNFKFVGQSDCETRTGDEQNVETNLRETLLKRNICPAPTSSNGSCVKVHFKTSPAEHSHMFIEQSGKPTKPNFNAKQASVVPQSRENSLRQDPDYTPESDNINIMSDSDISENSETATASTDHSRVGSPEIEIDVDLSQASEAIQQEEVISEAAENGNGPPASPGENVQPRKLPIFRKLPNPSFDPVAVFYYNPEATMLRRCSKYHSCCQMSADAAAVTKTDSSTQWEDPAILYELIKLNTLRGPQPHHHENGMTSPAYSFVRKKHGRYKIKGRSDPRLPDFSSILTASQDKKKSKKRKDLCQKPHSRKSVMSKPYSNVYDSSGCVSSAMPNPEILSSQSASASVLSHQYRLAKDILARESGKHQNVPRTSTFHISGQQQEQNISSRHSNFLSQPCTGSFSNTASANQVVSRANLVAGIPVVNNTEAPFRSISILRDTKVSALSGVQTSQPLATSCVQLHDAPSMVTEGDHRSRFLFKDGVLWQKVLKDDLFVWSKVDEDMYNIVRTTTPLKPHHVST